MSRRRRELTGTERALWRSVVRDVERLDAPSRSLAASSAKPSSRAAAEPSPRAAPKALEMPSDPPVPTGGLDRLAARLSGSGARTPPAGPPPVPAVSQRPRVLPPSYTPPQSRPGDRGAMTKGERGGPRRPAEGLEPRTRRRLDRGQAEPDARIDLHGMRQAAAIEALRSFVLASRARGHRLVLVVTGKGEPVGTPARIAANEGRGVIRRAVPRWLALPDLAPHVIGFEPAARRHGGEGALYVRLKR